MDLLIFVFSFALVFITLGFALGIFTQTDIVKDDNAKTIDPWDWE